MCDCRICKRLITLRPLYEAATPEQKAAIDDLMDEAEDSSTTLGMIKFHAKHDGVVWIDKIKFVREIVGE